MASRKNQQIAILCGGYMPPTEVERLRNDVRYDSAAIARAMGVPLQTYLNAVASPDPVPELPLNWTPTPGVGTAPYCRPEYVGVATIAYSHPWYPGYTFGTPVYINT